MANLATLIMEGAGTRTTSYYNMYDFTDTVIEESSYTSAAIATLFTDIMEAEQSYMVADVIGAATVIRESSYGDCVDPVSVQEGIITGGLEKLKAAFAKFIAKIKEYYKRVINWFKAMTSNASDFITNYGEMIKKKAAKVKDFHYDGYKYTPDKGKTMTDGIKDKIDKKLIDTLKGYDCIHETKSKAEFNNYLREKGIISKTFDEGESTSASEVVDDWLSSDLNFEDIAEMREEIVEAFRDGDTSTSDIKDFEANSASSMIDFMKKSDKQISEATKELNNYESKVNKVIKKLDSFKANKDEEGADNLVSHASYVSSLVSGYLNLYKVPCETRISMIKEISNTYLGVLKKFYNFKGNKEYYKEQVQMNSVIPFDAEAYATLENSIILEGDGEVNTNGSSDDTDEEEATESVVAGILEQAARYSF